MNVGNRYYLVAFDLDRDDWRSFRVDRAQNPHPGRCGLRPNRCLVAMLLVLSELDCAGAAIPG